MFNPKEMPVIDYYKKQEIKDSKTKKGRKDAENVVDYYLEKKQQKAILGFWLGTGAEELGFTSSNIVDTDLNNIFDGLHPKTGKKLFTVEKKPRKGAKKQASSFTDGPTTAIKGFSLFRNIDVKNRHIYDEIMRESIEELVKEAERLAWRPPSGKNREKSFDCKLMVAAIPHHTSRPTGEYEDSLMPDPNEHYHLLFSRKVKCADGKIRSARNYYLYNHQMYLGLVFRASMATKLSERLGFEIEKRKDFQLETIINKDGTETFKKTYYNSFEIKGFTEEMRNHFSKRSMEVNAEAEKLGLTGAIAKGYIASRKKRPKKVNLDEDTIQAHWKSEAEKFGITQEWIDSLKKFENSEVKNFWVEEKIIRSSMTAKHFKLGIVTDAKLMNRLYEHMQYTGVDAKKYKEHLIDKGYLIPTSQPFIYKVNPKLDLTMADFKQKSFRTALKTNYSKTLKSFLFNYIKSPRIKFTSDDMVSNKIPKKFFSDIVQTDTVKKKALHLSL